ncbi:cupredoxin domain-containing protein [Nocardia sp. NPDC127579]|uniref:cupredoxin domain-containing protein n=1 Tax=Nocardia sp. NPDC127579 TaxID=3345402 RepID=UPI003630AC0A
MKTQTRRYTAGILAALSSSAILGVTPVPAEPPTPAEPHAVHEDSRVTIDEYEYSVAVPMWLPPGTHTFTTNNTGHAPHDLVVSDLLGTEIARTAVVRPGDTAEVTVDLAPGVYQFWCSVGEHRQRGMNTYVVVL